MKLFAVSQEVHTAVEEQTRQPVRVVAQVWQVATPASAYPLSQGHVFSMVSVLCFVALQDKQFVELTLQVSQLRLHIPHVADPL